MGLVAAVNDSAGTVELAWGTYRGATGFAAYLVLRNQVERTRVDTVARIWDAAQTMFVDTSLLPNQAYEYRVSILTVDGLEVPSAAAAVKGFGIAPVELLEPETDPRQGVIRLHWHRFRDARFQACRVERRTTGLAPLQVAWIQDRDSLALAGTGLQGDVEHAYQVVVVTAAGEELAGAVAGEETLWESHRRLIRPGSVALAWLAGGSRLLGMDLDEDDLTDLVAVLQLDARGEAVLCLRRVGRLVFAAGPRMPPSRPAGYWRLCVRKSRRRRAASTGVRPGSRCARGRC